MNKESWGSKLIRAFLFLPSLLFMSKKKRYRDKIFFDDSGRYVTVAQMGFFLNRRNGERMFYKNTREFGTYVRSCQEYNLISDMMKADPNCAVMYWDHKVSRVGFRFPSKSRVARKIKEFRDTFK